MTLMPELKQELIAVAERRIDAPRRRRRTSAVGNRAAALAAAGAIVVASGAVAAATHVFDPAGSDRTPTIEGRSMLARTQTTRGEIAVLLYRNRSGQQCMAAGRPIGDTVAAATPGRVRELPLTQVGQCDLRPAPVAAGVIHSREETVVYGLTADDVTTITVEAAGAEHDAPPAADHAFIVAIPNAVSGAVTVTVTHANGIKEPVRVADLPSFDHINDLARRHQPPPTATNP
jgi:hypothetical protein